MKAITKSIVGFEVVKPDTMAVESKPEVNVVQMNESLQRPELLLGSTYKIKPPTDDHAMYVTINDVILNEGTEHEQRRPFEIFINSKNMEHYQWVVALTLLVSAVFRKGGDITFIAEEMSTVFDPQGGYFKRGGKFMPSLVAEIGEVIEKHLKMIGLIQDTELSAEQKQLIAEKKAQYEASKKEDAEPNEHTSDYPPESRICKDCKTKAVIKMDGCDVCLCCSTSKCS